MCHDTKLKLTVGTFFLLASLAFCSPSMAQTADCNNITVSHHTDYDDLSYYAWATGPSGNVGTTWYVMHATFKDANENPVGTLKPAWGLGGFQLVYSDDISPFPNDGTHYCFQFTPGGPSDLTSPYNTYFQGQGATHATYYYEVYSADETGNGSWDAENDHASNSFTVYF